jgi:ketosteroid isomerase-like protein
MSQENVDHVLGAYARFNGGDRTPSPEEWHNDAEYVVSQTDPDSDTHRGLPAISGQYARWVDAYPDLRVEPIEVEDHEDEVIVSVHFVGHGAASGVPIEMDLAHVVTVRDGKISRLVEYEDRPEALKAVGLAK